MPTPFNEKKFADIIRLSRLLGWENVGLYGHLVEDEFVFHFSDGKFDELYFQVNVDATVRCAVYDIPHGIYTGWHDIDERKLSNDLTGEAARLAPMFSKPLYLSPAKRKRLQKEHPEFCGFSWAKGGGLVNLEAGFLVHGNDNIPLTESQIINMKKDKETSQ